MENTNTQVVEEVTEVTQGAVLEEASKKTLACLNTEKYGFTDYAMLGLAGIGGLAILGGLGFAGYKGYKAIKKHKAAKQVIDISADEGVIEEVEDVFEDED